MRAVLTLIVAMIAGPLAQAETITIVSPFDLSSVTSPPCEKCKAMEKLRTQVFVRAQHNLNLKAHAFRKMAEVYTHGERLSEFAETNHALLRNATYASEIESFFHLVADALPFAQNMDAAETIAYLNSKLGSRAIFEKVLNDEVLSRPENSCRKKFFKQAVEFKECMLANDLAADAGRAPVYTCPVMTGSVSQCEAQKRAAERLRTR